MRRWRQVQEEAHGYQALCLRTSMQASNVALFRTSIRQLLNNAILRAALTRAESLILSHIRNFTRTASNLRMPSSWLKKSKSTKRLDQSYFIASSSRAFHWLRESAHQCHQLLNLKQSEIPGIHSATFIFFLSFLRMQSSSTQKTQKWNLSIIFILLVSVKFHEKLLRWQWSLEQAPVTWLWC